jgi:isoquinoline 1-oxidoreductase subunit beta
MNGAAVVPNRGRRRLLQGLAGSWLIPLHAMAQPPAKSTTTGTAANQAQPWQALATLVLQADGRAMLVFRKVEMGQGAHEGLLTLVADELDLPADRFGIQQAPSRPAFGQLVTGGSFTAAGAERFLRRQVAGVRTKLVGVAAARWQVEATACRTEAGVVLGPNPAQHADYASLIDDARQLPDLPPAAVVLRPLTPAATGKRPLPAALQADVEAIVRGRLRYGIDARPDGARVAVLVRAPALNAQLLSFDDAACQEVPGFERCVVLKGNRFPALNHVRASVAVVARDTWSALQAREKLQVRWDLQGASAESSVALLRRLRQVADADPPMPVATDARSFSWALDLPAYPHLPLEPPNAVAEPVAGTASQAAGLRLHTGTQRQTRLHDALVNEHGFQREAVEVTCPRLGGGFGRKLEVDYGIEAALLSRELGQAVQVLWTRDDDIQHGVVRPPSAHRIDLQFDGRRIVRWRHVLAGGSVHAQQEPAEIAKDAGDWTMRMPMQGMVYGIEAAEHFSRPVAMDVPLGWWRGTGWTQSSVATECALNALCRATGQDPVGLRIRHLAGQAPREVRVRPEASLYLEPARLLNVLQRVAVMARWPLQRAAPACAFYDCDGTYVAIITQAAAARGRETARISRVWVSVDCGRVLTPDVVHQQIESSVVFALSALKSGGLHWEQGRVRESSLADLPLLTMAEFPQIEIDVVASDAAVSGIGEPVVPVMLAAAMSALGRDGQVPPSAPTKATA